MALPVDPQGTVGRFDRVTALQIPLPDAVLINRLSGRHVPRDASYGFDQVWNVQYNFTKDDARLAALTGSVPSVLGSDYDCPPPAGVARRRRPRLRSCLAGPKGEYLPAVGKLLAPFNPFAALV